MTPAMTGALAVGPLGVVVFTQVLVGVAAAESTLNTSGEAGRAKLRGAVYLAAGLVGVAAFAGAASAGSDHAALAGVVVAGALAIFFLRVVIGGPQ